MSSAARLRSPFSGAATGSTSRAPTEPTYTLGGAQLGDDGALFQVTMSASNGLSSTAGVVLLVSPLPGVVFQDADFPVSNWTVTATAQPTQNGPTHAESQATDGGNPGRLPEHHYQMTAGPSSLESSTHFASARPTNPPAQGAIYTIDLVGTCGRASVASGVDLTGLTLSPMFEQAGRTYQPRRLARVLRTSPYWSAMRVWSVKAERIRPLGSGLRAATNVPRLLGDSAAPLRFGFVTQAGPRRRLTRRLQSCRASTTGK